jgi:hypothetical protein
VLEHQLCEQRFELCTTAAVVKYKLQILHRQSLSKRRR